MKKGRKYAEEITFEVDEQSSCITDCPYEISMGIEGYEHIPKKVGSRGCSSCVHYSSWKNNTTIKCLYQYHKGKGYWKDVEVKP